MVYLLSNPPTNRIWRTRPYPFDNPTSAVREEMTNGLEKYIIAKKVVGISSSLLQTRAVLTTGLFGIHFSGTQRLTRFPPVSKKSRKMPYQSPSVSLCKNRAWPNQ